MMILYGFIVIILERVEEYDMNKKIAIWGWWQGNNLGDNWIKNTLKLFFPDADYLPTSVQDFTEYDFVICGGGGLFIYDVINPFKKVDIGVPYGIWGMGAEFEHSSNIAVELEKKAEFFLVRDQYSIDCMHLSKKSRSYDLTFLNPLPFLAENDNDINNVFFVWRDGKELINNSKFAEYICYKDVEDEWNFYLNSEFKTIVCDDFQTEDGDILNRIKGCGFVVSGRYHGIVAAIQLGLPFIAIDICPKIRALTEECGLSEYCIKISEVDKINSLIKKAKGNVKEIRNKELEYVKNASSCLYKQVIEVKKSIYKKIYPFIILHYGSYWMGENDVVNVMSDDLINISDTTKIDLRAYSKEIDGRIKRIDRTPNGTVCTLDTRSILNDLCKYNPDAIVLNSGGLCMEQDLIVELKKREITSIGISLSDPDVYVYNGEKYAKNFDIFYTNSRWSYENQYDKTKVNINIMPFAASMKHHYYIPEIERKYDLVIVGHARKDRIPIVNELKKVCNVGLYGSGWKDGLGVVNGIDHVRAINSGKMYLSFSHTMAGYNNVKVGLFEAMACRQFVLTSYMKELSEYFEIGKEIICYETEEELIELVKYYLKHDEEREKIMNAGYTRFIRDHTYQERWTKVIKDIYEIKNVNRNDKNEK